MTRSLEALSAAGIKAGRSESSPSDAASAPLGGSTGVAGAAGRLAPSRPGSLRAVASWSRAARDLDDVGDELVRASGVVGLITRRLALRLRNLSGLSKLECEPPLAGAMDCVAKPLRPRGLTFTPLDGALYDTKPASYGCDGAA
eukprot:scaffold1800_cov237-Pinguiococcus_pyrenoidosus.AAC.7